MNWRTRSWEERFGHLSATPGDEGGDDGGAGGTADTGDDGGGGTQDDSGSEASGDDADQVDLGSTDPADIIRFPAGHRLTQEQLKALMGYNPKQKESLKDPTVKQKEPVTPEAKTAKPPAKKSKEEQVDPKAPVWDPKVKRWRDPESKKIVPAPKGAKPPEPDPAAAQPQAQLTPQQIAQIAAAAAKGATQPAQPKTDPSADKGPKPFYGSEGGAPAMVIPDELAQGVFSDDPATAKASIEAVINGMSNVIMRDVQGMIMYAQRQMAQQLPGMITTHTAAQKGPDIFYDRYPMLDNPVLHSGIDQIGRAVAKQWAQGGIPWQKADGSMTDDFIDAVAAAVSEATGISLAPAQTALQPAQVAPKSKRTFFNRGPQARPPAATQTQEKSADIINTISFRRHG